MTEHEEKYQTEYVWRGDVLENINSVEAGEDGFEETYDEDYYFSFPLGEKSWSENVNPTFNKAHYLENISIKGETPNSDIKFEYTTDNKVSRIKMEGDIRLDYAFSYSESADGSRWTGSEMTIEEYGEKYEEEVKVEYVGDRVSKITYEDDYDDYDYDDYDYDDYDEYDYDEVEDYDYEGDYDNRFGDDGYDYDDYDYDDYDYDDYDYDDYDEYSEDGKQELDLQKLCQYDENGELIQYQIERDDIVLKIEYQEFQIDYQKWKNFRNRYYSQRFGVFASIDETLGEVCKLIDGWKLQEQIYDFITGMGMVEYLKPSYSMRFLSDIGYLVDYEFLKEK